MQKKNRLLSLLVGGLSAATALVAAETPSDPAKEEAITLSPFVISSSNDTGWVATETLAGSRLRTNFKDVPNQIETLTKDFMLDLDLTTVQEAMMYTANVENVSEYVAGEGASAANNPGQSGRVRSIGQGTPTQNFFTTSLPSDTYNLERATVAAGPNAILFGLGSPAGIIDATPARATMRDRYSVSLRFDDRGSRRGTFDANKAIIADKVALRLIGMSKREFVFKEPNHDRDERLFGAITLKPFKRTTLIAQGERVKRDWNRPVRVAPGDSVSLWYRAHEIAGSGYSAPMPAYDNRRFTNLGNDPIFVRAGNVPVLTSTDGVMRNWQNSVTVRNPRDLPTVDPTYDAETVTSLLDSSIFPLDVNLFGSFRTVQLGGNQRNIILEQQILPDLFLELAWNGEQTYSHQRNTLGGAQFQNLHVDANQFLPDQVTPNPSFGQLYYQAQSQNSLSWTEREDLRATLSYEFDAARRLGARHRWLRWAGRHRFAGLYTQSEREDRDQQNWARRILGDPVLPGHMLRPKTFQNWATHSTRVPQFRHYLDPVDPTRSLPTQPGPFEGEWMLRDANGNPFELTMYDGGLVSSETGKRIGGGNAPSGSLQRTRSFVFAWQGFFLPDKQQQARLVLTYGYRKDFAKVATLDFDSTAQDFSGLYPVIWDANFAEFGEEQSGINRNIGVVARPLHWLSLFYNKSTTFDLNVGRYDPFGNEYPGAGGDGQDYGVRLDLWQNKVVLRLNRYENDLGPQRATNQINAHRDPIWNIENRVRTLDPSVPTINVTDGNLRGYRNAGRPNYWIMSDFRSTGYELSLDVSPVRNWSIRFNGARTEAVESNIGADWFAYVQQRLPVWEGVVARNGEVDANGQPVTWATAPFNLNQPTGLTLQQYYDREQSTGFNFISALDGRATDGSRPMRFNLITNYRIEEGRFRGLSLGGAARWRDQVKIGYATKPDPDNPGGTALLDLDRPYMSDRELFFDANIGYRNRIRAFGGLRYRLQLNVRNLLDEDAPVAVAANTLGEVVRIATVDPRSVSVTCTFEF